MNFRSNLSVFLLLLLVTSNSLTMATTFEDSPSIAVCKTSLLALVISGFKALQDHFAIKDDLNIFKALVATAGTCSVALAHAKLPANCKNALLKLIKDTTGAVPKFILKPTKDEALVLLHGIKADIDALEDPCQGYL